MLNKLTILSILLFNSLIANDILTEYRLHGIDNIEKKLDYELTQKNYWEEYLQNKETTFGYIESYSNVLVCNKFESTLTLYQKDSNDSYQVTKTYSAYTGKAKGDKFVEGDLKTPVGIYNLVKKIVKVDSFYGPMAFVTSYPNVYDTYQGKNGSGIWIHGLPTEQERDEFTKGCIAINNQNIECLDRHIDINKTLLVINEDSVLVDISKNQLATLLANLYSWRYAWLYNDTNQYLSFYDATFKRYDGMEKEAFEKYKTRVFNKQESKTILFTQINILPYPNLEDTFQITFEETYRSNSFSFNGEKVLIVKLTNEKFQIITEK
ncbi:MAG: L,D-transpeptidase family protein [Campylobacterales bacterium]|nr:L,D-transpeptidase family protein [Campylobacterales bacterium]